MKRLFFNTIIVITFLMLTAGSVSALNTNAQTNAPINSSTKPTVNVEKFRDKPALLPLLLIPLAIGMYLLYERFSDRRK
jgi:hypothetical protein